MVLNPDGPFSLAWDAWRSGGFQVAVCNELLDEVQDVLARPKISKRLNNENKADLISLLKHHTLMFKITKPYPKFEDEDDRFLLALLEESSADVLVTGDAALESLNNFAGTLIIKPKVFLEALS